MRKKHKELKYNNGEHFTEREIDELNAREYILRGFDLPDELGERLLKTKGSIK